MKLSVLIVSYNVRYYLEQCLHSVWKAAEGLETEVFVVDNNSTDDSIDYLHKRFPAADYPHLHLIQNARNVGFGCANNQALERVTGEYVLFLNPDTLLTEETLKECLCFADAHPDMGGLGLKMLNADGRFAFESRRGLPTPWTAFCKMSGLCNLFPHSRRFGRYYMRYLDENKPESIEILSGAFFMLRRSHLEKGGGFDERFFMYGEDIDLSYRLILEGWRNYYIPTPIVHYKGESTHKSSFRYVHVFYSAMLIFFKKHYCHYGMLLSLPIRMAIVGKGILSLVASQMKDFRKYISINQRREECRYLFVGRRKSIAAVRRLAAEWVLSIDFKEMDETGQPEGHLSLGDSASAYQCVIYDISAYSLIGILRIFERAPGKHTMGTYNPATGVIITKDCVFTRKSKYEE